MIVAGGGAGVLILIFLFLPLLSVISVVLYLIRKRRYTRLNLPVPPLKKWQCLMLYGPVFVFILFSLLIFWIIKEDEKLVQFEHEKDKNRYFTLEKDTPFGEIILPKGTHMSKYIPKGYQYNAAADLNDIDGIEFPHPVNINGLSVIKIAPTTGFLHLAEDYRFIDQNGKVLHCPQTHYFIVELNNYELKWQYLNKSLPVPPSTFKPSLWTFSDCTSKIDFPSPLPYWQGDKLIIDN